MSSALRFRAARLLAIAASFIISLNTRSGQYNGLGFPIGHDEEGPTGRSALVEMISQVRLQLVETDSVARIHRLGLHLKFLDVESSTAPASPPPHPSSSKSASAFLQSPRSPVGGF